MPNATSTPNDYASKLHRSLERSSPPEWTRSSMSGVRRGRWRGCGRATRACGPAPARERGGWAGSYVASAQLADADRFSVLVEDVRSGGFEDAVLVGMGGSSLCPEVLSLTFAAQTAGLPRLRVLDSTDPRQIKTLQEQIDLSKTLFFVSSKSGSTLEPKHPRPGVLPRARKGSPGR